SLHAAIPVSSAVMSLSHSSTPCTYTTLFRSASVAKKNNVPLACTRLLGLEPLVPGLMSATITVPAAVPSLFHSSAPCVPSVAVKKMDRLRFVGGQGAGRGGWGPA